MPYRYRATYVCERCEAEYAPCAKAQQYCSRSCARRDKKLMSLEEKARSERNSQLKYRYGITLERYEQMLALQDNACAVCKTHEGRGLNVDHDHSCCPGRRSCGQCVRALLCDRCNTILGHAQDDIERLRACIDYLRVG